MKVATRRGAVADAPAHVAYCERCSFHHILRRCVRVWAYDSGDHGECVYVSIPPLFPDSPIPFSACMYNLTQLSDKISADILKVLTSKRWRLIDVPCRKRDAKTTSMAQTKLGTDRAMQQLHHDILALCKAIDHQVGPSEGASWRERAYVVCEVGLRCTMDNMT